MAWLPFHYKIHMVCGGLLFVASLCCFDEQNCVFEEENCF